MKTSTEIDKLAMALVKAQGEITNPKKSAKNPFYNSKYTPLEDIINHTKPILQAHGLSIMQPLDTIDGHPAITTILLHTSGQCVSSSIIMDPEKFQIEYTKKEKQIMETGTDPQKVGIMITYYRRYGQSAILNLASEDDTDGNRPVTKTGPSKIDTMLYKINEMAHDKAFTSEETVHYSEKACNLHKLGNESGLLELGTQLKENISDGSK